MSDLPQLRRYGAEDPVALRRQDAAQHALDQLALTGDTPYGKPTGIQRKNYTAKLGELVLVDPSTAALIVYLPKIGRQDLGRAITVWNASASTNAVTAAAAKNDDIFGDATNESTIAWHVRVFVAASKTQWLMK